MTKQEVIAAIEKLIENGYAETRVGFHAEYRLWNGQYRRGAYAQIAEPYGATTRRYERSYAELLTTLASESLADPLNRKREE